jgi:hypothetical protein
LKKEHLYFKYFKSDFPIKISKTNIDALSTIHF